MAIIRPENMNFSGQRFSAIIYGSPGIGKTTLALSAPAPILIDFDRGISRVRAQHRMPTIIQSYDHALTSKKECSALLMQKAAALGFKYSKAAGGFVAKEQGNE